MIKMITIAVFNKPKQLQQLNNFRHAEHFRFTYDQCVHHKSHNKCLGDNRVLSICALQLLHQLQQLHLKFLPVTLLKTVAMVACGGDP